MSKPQEPKTYDDLEDRKLYSVRDVARVTNLRAGTVYELEGRGVLRRARGLGHAVKFLGKEIRRFLDDADPNPEPPRSKREARGAHHDERRDGNGGDGDE